MRPFQTPLCLAGQQFASTRAVLRRVACHKSCKICLECPWQHLSLSLGRNTGPDQMFFQLDATPIRISPTRSLLAR